VPLLGENRILASYGLGGLACSENPGLRELRRCASIDGKELSSFDVAFKLAPRLNAAGRLGTARKAVELLTTDSEETAREIARFLSSENTRRQKIQEGIFLQTIEMLGEYPLVDGRSAIVLASEGWHAGVVGIVAAKLVEKFYRPAVVLVIDGDEAHGSARSVEGLHLYDALAQCDALLTGYGGHSQAAGLHMRAERVDEFRGMFSKVVADRLSPDDMSPLLRIDADVQLESLTPALLRELKSLEPHGQGNPEPIFAARGLKVAGKVERRGVTGSVLSFFVRQGDTTMRAVAFGMGDAADRLQAAGECSLAYQPVMDKYMGRNEIQLKIKDMRINGEPAPDDRQGRS
jgi:single-stranded-DNA-specific exonuclease